MFKIWQFENPLYLFLLLAGICNKFFTIEDFHIEKIFQLKKGDTGK
jgi:hypothetical protein